MIITNEFAAFFYVIIIIIIIMIKMCFAYIK